MRSTVLAPWLFAAALLGEAAAPLAQDATGRVAAPAIDCTCRFQGRDFHLGEQACLNSPDGPRWARCATVLNNTSWEFTAAPCAIAGVGGRETGQLAANGLPTGMR